MYVLFPHHLRLGETESLVNFCLLNSSEGVQIGGICSAAGIVGTWTGVSHEDGESYCDPFSIHIDLQTNFFNLHMKFLFLYPLSSMGFFFRCTGAYHHLSTPSLLLLSLCPNATYR